jgi:SAM-dependent methyltransferase
MTAASDHYDRLLAAHYTWILGGDVGSAAGEQARLLRDRGVRPGAAGGAAVDLGCGPGPQSLALAAVGFEPVMAVDTSGPLLEELRTLAGRSSQGPAIRTLQADIRTVLAEHCEPSSQAAVVCMGDTLTHLPGKDDVTALLDQASACLASGGHLVLTYRDLTAPRTGTDRFLPVRATNDRITTCFLEYVDQDTVMVHDVIHTRAHGAWRQQVGSYPKLRIGTDWLVAACRLAGLDVRHSAPGPRGLQVITAVKP